MLCEYLIPALRRSCSVALLLSTALVAQAPICVVTPDSAPPGVPRTLSVSASFPFTLSSSNCFFASVHENDASRTLSPAFALPAGCSTPGQFLNFGQTASQTFEVPASVPAGTYWLRCMYNQGGQNYRDVWVDFHVSAPASPLLSAGGAAWGHPWPLNLSFPSDPNAIYFAAASLGQDQRIITSPLIFSLEYDLLNALSFPSANPFLFTGFGLNQFNAAGDATLIMNLPAMPPFLVGLHVQAVVLSLTTPGIVSLSNCVDTATDHRSRVSQHGITWHFSQPRRVGQFVNGDWWVIGPVDIVAINPPSYTTGSRTKNGSMVNPMAGTHAHGYDSSAYGQYNGGQYDASLNVSLGVSPANPLTLAGPGIKSLVSTLSRSDPGVDPQIKTAAVLTVLETVPPPDSFRPPYAGTNKSVMYRFSQLDMSLLRNLPKVSSTPSMSSVAKKFKRPWIDHSPGWMGSFLHPMDNMQSYARDIANDVSIGALMLHLDFTPQQKKALLASFVQVGIDLKGVADANGSQNWIGMAGHGSGRKWPILFSGMLLGDQGMMDTTRTATSGVRFAEDGQTFIVQNLPGGINGGHGGYTSAHLGMPEWGTQHDHAPHLDDVTWYATGQNVAYRVCCTATAWVGTVLAARITPGGRTAWGHDPLFLYQDRYMITQHGGFRAQSDFAEQMWDVYRPLTGPSWPSLNTDK